MDGNRKMILVTGCPRSGTGYMAKLMQSLGLDIGHEKMGKDGISAYREAIPEKIKQYDTVIHIVRHPLHVIGSLTTIVDKSWKFTYEHTVEFYDKSLIYRCMKLWLDWNEMIEDSSKKKKRIFRCKVEDMPDYFLEHLALYKLIRYGEIAIVNVIRGNNGIPKNYNSRKHIKLTWDDLYKEGHSMADKIYFKSQIYGYGEKRDYEYLWLR